MTTDPALSRDLARDLDAAFPRLVRAHQDVLFGTALRFTGCREDASDLTQETFVRAYRALQGYPPQRIRALKVRPWLWTIAANQCRNHLRNRRRRPITAHLDGNAEPAALDPSLDDLGHGPLEAALVALPGPQRLAVLMRHVAGIPVSEIAAALDRPAGTVKSDIHRGLAILRAALEEHGEEAS